MCLFQVDFPFRVTELEHAIIHLRSRPAAPVLLLGRSGTGKTTCCLYRCFDQFVRYWETLGRHGRALERRPVFLRDAKRDQQGTDDTEAGSHLPLFLAVNEIQCIPTVLFTRC